MDKTATVQVATSSDIVYRWFLRRIMNIIPDVDRFDFADRVREGINISSVHDLLPSLVLLVLYCVPFALLAYYLIKWREVATGRTLEGTGPLKLGVPSPSRRLARRLAMASRFQQQSVQRKLIYPGLICCLFWRCAYALRPQSTSVEAKANQLSLREENRGEVELTGRAVNLLPHRLARRGGLRPLRQRHGEAKEAAVERARAGRPLGHQAATAFRRALAARGLEHRLQRLRRMPRPPRHVFLHLARHRAARRGRTQKPAPAETCAGPSA